LANSNQLPPDERRVTFLAAAHRRPPPPCIRSNQLCLPDEQGGCRSYPVGSPAWFDWLQTVSAFRFLSTQPRSHTSRPLRPISVRKEKRRQGFLWYAYLRRLGQLHKRYLGRTQTLTREKLDAVALDLNAA